MKSLKSLLISISILSSGFVFTMEQERKKIKLDSSLFNPEVDKKMLGKELIIAVKNHSWCRNDIESIKKLINSGADVNAKDEDGNTPLILASKEGYRGIVDLLIKSSLDIDAKNKKGRTALIESVFSGNQGVVSLLIKSGAEINLKDSFGWNALMYGVKNKEMVHLLIKAGIDINVKDLSGQTLFDYIDIYERLNFIEKSEIEKIIKDALIKREQIKKFKEELFKAIEDYNVDLVENLVKKVTLNLHDQDGNNALHLAVVLPEDTNEKLENKKQIIGLLLIYRKDLISEKNKLGLTSLEFALSKGKFKIVELLIKLATSKKQ